MFNINDKITSSQNTQEDSYSIFKKAVNNGQTRLALEALTDVLDSIIAHITEKPKEEVIVLSPVVKVEDEELVSSTKLVSTKNQKTKISEE